MTTKNFLLFQAGKQGGSGRTIPEELFKPENFGKVLTLRGADDNPYLGAEDLPKLFIADFGRTPFLDVKNAYDSGTVVVCYHNDMLYQLSSFNGFKIEFARTLKDADDKIFYSTTTVTENGWVSNDIELAAGGIEEAPSDDRPYVRKNGDWEVYAPQFTFGDDVDVGEFAEAVASNKTLVYVTSVTHPVSHTRSNKQFNLSGTEQRAGRPDTTLHFERIEGAVLSKVDIVWDTVAETLTFGDVEDYDIETEKLSDAPSDDKTYARKNGAWEEVVEGAATFVATYGSTTFADIQQAIADGKCVKCDMSGYTYELVNELPNKLTFAATNNVNGVVTQETVWANSDNTWGNEGVNLAKTTDVPTKTSDLENDEGYVKEDALPTKTSDLQNDNGFIGTAELEVMADKQIAITTPPGSIQQSYNFAQGRYDASITTLHGYLFAVPNEVLIKEDETKITVLCTSIPHNALSVGIFEYDFNGNEGRGSTTWLCDTGSVNLVLGENRLPVKYIKRNTPTQPVIKLEPSKVYYACLMIGPTKSGFDSRDVSLASSNSVVYVHQSNPALVLRSIVEPGEVDWTVGTMENAWFKGYIQADGPMPYMMIRNGEGLPVVITDPFDNLESWSLFNTYRVSNIFNMANFGTRPAVYQKIIPKKNVNVKKITYVDYHASIKAVNAPAIVDNNYNILVDRSGYVVTQGDNDGTKLGQFYIHELTLNEPFTMLKDTQYWVPAGLNISNGTNEWVITYQSPDDLRRDLFICVDDDLIAPGSGAMERAYDQYAPFCRIMTDENIEYTF